MSYDEHEFRIRLGRIRDRGGRTRRFVAEVLQAAAKAGHDARRYEAGKRRASGRFGRGRGVALAAALRSPTRRVVVQVRIVRHRGLAFRNAPLSAHLRYLQREGVDREERKGRLFNRAGEVDAGEFARRCEGDRHHFRFMVSPEDAAELQDLERTTCELIAQAERDLGTRLDWAAADHWNTAHPHVHILIRGKDQAGQDLVISRDYITRGFRARAEALVSLELGPRSAREIAADLQRQVSAERWTRLDQLLAELARDGRVDLRPGQGAPDLETRPLLLGRVATLERLGLARSEGAGVWRLSETLEAGLRDLALRGDIIKTLHRAMTRSRGGADFDLAGEGSAEPLVGRLADRGLFDEQAGSAYVVIDGVDGRAHHVRLADLGATGDTPLGGIVEMRPAGPERPCDVIHRSDLPLEAQIVAEGATWLDRRLLAPGRAAHADTGFGAEVEAALEARRRHLAGLGLAARGSRGWTLARGLLAELRRRELMETGERIARETGLRFEGEADEPRIRGIYRRRLDLASGRFAMVEDGLGFRLAPWARVLDRRLGKEVSGVVRERGVDWEIERRRGLSR